MMLFHLCLPFFFGASSTYLALPVSSIYFLCVYPADLDPFRFMVGINSCQESSLSLLQEINSRGALNSGELRFNVMIFSIKQYSLMHIHVIFLPALKISEYAKVTCTEVIVNVLAMC
jgi:hypothetical protein